LSVDVGVLAFMPGSQVDIRPLHNLDHFVGQDIPVKILKLNRRRGNVVPLVAQDRRRPRTIDNNPIGADAYAPA